MPDHTDDNHAPRQLRVVDPDESIVESPVHELMPLPASLSQSGDSDLAQGSASEPSNHDDNDSSGLVTGPITQRPKRARRGDVIGNRYVVDGQIGKGGMGRVLRVRHQVLGKYFALKVIRPPIAMDKRVCEMFYREARLASSLAHDNICSIVDFGNDPDVGLFMVMELLEGRSLYKKLRDDGPLPPKAACAVMWDIAKAVKHMHDRSIVHGDIKSRNILLVRTPHKHRVVKLTDFGLARVDIARTSHVVEGTPEYMAPELIRGHAASPRSDIYALGILFYEVLIGIQPFKGETDEVFRRHLEDPLPKPSELLDNAIDERADEVIAKATAKEPADRHQDVGGLLFELRALMNMLGIGTYQRPRTSVAPPRGQRKRNRSVERRTQGGSEVFENAPIPLAAVSDTGKVRVANVAFMEFLGVAGDAAGIDLADSHLPEVYPHLMSDLRRVASSRTTIKRLMKLRDRKKQNDVEIVIILKAAPRQTAVTAGDVHLALHPLGRVQRDGD